jgi:hypothetical protein
MSDFLTKFPQFAEKVLSETVCVEIFLRLKQSSNWSNSALQKKFFIMNVNLARILLHTIISSKYRAEKAKLIERWGRKATGLEQR